MNVDINFGVIINNFNSLFSFPAKEKKNTIMDQSIGYDLAFFHKKSFYMPVVFITPTAQENFNYEGSLILFNLKFKDL